MGTAIKHPAVPDRALWRSAVSVRVTGCQKL